MCVDIVANALVSIVFVQCMGQMCPQSIMAFIPLSAPSVCSELRDLCIGFIDDQCNQMPWTFVCSNGSTGESKTILVYKIPLLLPFHTLVLSSPEVHSDGLPMERWQPNYEKYNNRATLVRFFPLHTQVSLSLARRVQFDGGDSPAGVWSNAVGVAVNVR